MRSSSRRSSPISPHISPASRLYLAYISQVLDALDVSGNPLANEGVSALLLAHHALPAERPCRLRMEEVCVRPGSNLPLLLAKLSAGEPIEMQAISREIEQEIAPPRIPHTTLRHAVRACPLLPPRCPSAYSRQRPGAPPPPTLNPGPGGGGRARRRCARHVQGGRPRQEVQVGREQVQAREV